MATNEILRFAETDTGTNLLTQAEYLADSQRPIGNQPGVARSKLVNKALRQASLIAAGIAEYIADNQANNITDALTPQNIADYLQAALTGALGVTPPLFDNDTSLATTAFVQRALGNFSGEAAYNVDTQLTGNAFGRLIIFAGSAVANRTFTLPLAAAGASGCKITFWNNSSYNLTVVPFAGDFLDTGTSVPASIVLGPGSTLVCETFSSVGWRLIGGTARLKNSHEFSSSLAASGYQKLPSGLIIQWGGTSAVTTTTTPANLSVTLPIAFPNNILPVVVTRATDVAASASPFTVECVSATSTTQFIITHVRSAGSTTNSWRWIAIGY